MEHLGIVGTSEDASSSKRVRSLLASSTSSADTSSESDSQDSYHTAPPGSQNIDPAAIGESQSLPEEVEGEVELVSAPTGANEPLSQDMDVDDADDDQQPLNPAPVELDRQLGSSSNEVVLSPGPVSSGGGLSRSDNKKGSHRPPNIMENKSCDPKQWTLLKCWSKRMYDAFEAHRLTGYLEYSKRGLGKKFYTTIHGQKRKISIDDPEFQIFEILTLGELQEVGEDKACKLQIEASEIQCANNMESDNPIPKWTLTSYLELAELLHKSLKVGDYFAVWGAKYTLKSKWVMLNSFGAITVPETVMTIYRHRHESAAFDPAENFDRFHVPSQDQNVPHVLLQEDDSGICDLVQELFLKPSSKTGEAQQVEKDGSDNDNRLSSVDEGSDEDRGPNQDNVNSDDAILKELESNNKQSRSRSSSVEIVADIPDSDTEEEKPSKRKRNTNSHASVKKPGNAKRGKKSEIFEPDSDDADSTDNDDEDEDPAFSPNRRYKNLKRRATRRLSGSSHESLTEFMPDEVDGEVELVSALAGANEPLSQDMDVDDADDDQQPLNPAPVEEGGVLARSWRRLLKRVSS